MFAGGSGNIEKNQGSTVLDPAERNFTEKLTIGRCQVDGDALTVVDGERVTTLEPRAFRVLRYLANHPGKLVTIDELMDVHWADTVVTPNSVTRVVAQLRKALGDDARNPEYIETVARTGYRLIASVTTARDAGRSRSRLAVAAALLAMVALAWWLWPQPERAPTIAVLPFANFTGDESLEYIGDGVAEEVINALAKVPDLKVSARSLSFRFKEADNDPREFSRDLEVAYFVEGSVRRNGQKMRFTAQLIDVETGYHVWSHASEHDQLALFEGQDAISRDLTAALTDELDLVNEASNDLVRSPEPEAYDLYLRGRQIWHRRGSQPLQPAVDYFSEAVRVDPEFARGWAALASAYLSWPSYSPKGYGTWADAEESARKALDLDPDLAEPYSVLGTFAQLRRKWGEAHRLFLEGVRKDDRNATAHFWLSEHLLQIGHVNESYRQLRRTMELDPLYKAPRTDLAWAQIMFGDPQVGAAAFRALWDGGFQSIESWVGNYMSLIAMNQYDVALEWLEQSPMPDAGKDKHRRFLHVLLGYADDPTLADELITPPRVGLDHRDLLYMTARLGRYDATFKYVRVRLEYDAWIDLMVLWGVGTETRLQPGFPEIVGELGLVDFWDEAGWGDICRKDSGDVICDARDVDLSILE